MASEEHEKVARQGSPSIEEWLRAHPGVRLDLAGADLSKCDFLNAELSGANLTGANLSASDLRGANLSQATLESANLFRARLQGADLLDSILRSASLSEAELSGSRLIQADLSAADLSNADFSFADLRKANLRQSLLMGTNLEEARLDGSNLEEANLCGANLTGCNLSRANLAGANLSEAILIRAVFFETRCDSAIFRGAQCGSTIFANSDFSLALGLEHISHRGASEVGIAAFDISGGRFPRVFLSGCGISQRVRETLRAFSNEDFYSCFISYSPSDEEFARELYEQLINKGVRVWFAPEHMKPGRRIHDEIETAITKTDKLLLVLSEASIQSGWVADEVVRMVRKDAGRLFPIRICNWEVLRTWRLFDPDLGIDIAARIREYFIPDFSSWKSREEFEKSFNSVLEGLEKPTHVPTLESFPLNLPNSVVTELTAIRASFHEFGHLYLGRVQREELNSVFAEFYFYLHERVAQASFLDLVPFFRQVGRMFSCTELWSSYFDETERSSANWFDQQVQSFLAFLRGAFQERADAQFNHSRTFSRSQNLIANKLTGAYSGALWVANNLLQPDANTHIEHFIEAERFGAAITIGGDEILSGRELFPEFRLYVEKLHGKRLSEIAPNNWTERICLFQVSRSLAVQPDIGTVLCIRHFCNCSEWIMATTWGPLRFSLNRWILQEAIANVATFHAINASPTQRDIAVAEYLLLFRLAQAIPHTGPLDDSTLQPLIQTLCKNYDPRQMIGFIRDATALLGPYDSIGPAHTSSDLSSFANPRFIAALNALEYLNNEVVDDIGVFCVLDHMLRSRGIKRSADSRFEDVSRIFLNELVLMGEFIGPKRHYDRITRMIVHRWAIQAAATLGTLEFTSRILDRVDNVRKLYPHLLDRSAFETMLDSAQDYPLQFSLPSGLVDQLRRLHAYGGEVDVAFPTVESYPESIRTVIDAFVDAWHSRGGDESQSRLVQRLWAAVDVKPTSVVGNQLTDALRGPRINY